MQHLKSKQKFGLFISIILVGSIVILGVGLLGYEIPSIIIDTGTGDNGPKESSVTGHMGYDMVVRFSDGSNQKFSKNIELPAFKLPTGSLFSDSSKTKEIVGIDIMANSDMDLPNNLSGVDNNVLWNGVIHVKLNDTEVATKTFANTFTLSDLDKPLDLYTFTITPSQLTGLQNGPYTLSFNVQDNFTFKVAGMDKTLTIKAKPTLYYKDLKPLYAVITSQSVNFDLEKTANRSNDGEITSYSYYVLVTAKGFKPNSPVTFDWNVPVKTDNYDLRNAAVDKIVTSDAQGTATDRVFAERNGGNIQCTDYYAFITISDGTTSIGPIKLGCSWTYDTNPGVVIN